LENERSEELLKDKEGPPWRSRKMPEGKVGEGKSFEEKLRL